PSFANGFPLQTGGTSRYTEGSYPTRGVPAMLRPALLMGPILLLAPTVRADDAETFFETKIRPVLVESCLKCHGGKKVSNRLRVDAGEALLKGGDHGAAIVPGKPDAGLLVQAIRQTHAEIKMPPDKRLPDSVVADFAAWVRDGAAWPKTVTLQAKKHWAFEP